MNRDGEVFVVVTTYHDAFGSGGRNYPAGYTEVEILDSMPQWEPLTTWAYGPLTQRFYCGNVNGGDSVEVTP